MTWACLFWLLVARNYRMYSDEGTSEIETTVFMQMRFILVVRKQDVTPDVKHLWIRPCSLIISVTCKKHIKYRKAWSKMCGKHMHLFRMTLRSVKVEINPSFTEISGVNWCLNFERCHSCIWQLSELSLWLRFSKTEI